MASGMRYAYNIQPQVYQGGKDTILPYFVDDEAGGMFSHKIITIIPLYWQLQFLVSSRVVTAAVLPLGAPPRDLPLGAKPFPDHAPPFPWNEETCGGVQAEHISLTFSWGEPLPENRIYRCILDSLDTFEECVAAGLADFALDKEYVIGIDGVRDIKIKARPYQKYFWSQSEFDMQRVGVAVELMRKCGLDSGVFREMWAFVYSVGKLIGYIWLEQDRVDPDGLRNGTAGLLGS